MQHSLVSRGLRRRACSRRPASLRPSPPRRRPASDLRPREVQVRGLHAGVARRTCGSRRSAPSPQQRSRHVLVGHARCGTARNDEPARSVDGQRLDSRPQEPPRRLGAERRVRPSAAAGARARSPAPCGCPPGTYEAFYPPFPNMYWTDEDGDTSTAQRFLELARRRRVRRIPPDDSRRRAGRSPAPTPSARAATFETGAVVALRGDGGQKFLQARLRPRRARPRSRSTPTGEAREDAEFDAGWIINADTREKVWKLTWRDSAPAGGAAKNRMARITKTLPAGRYAAFYATDDSHDPAQWNAAPPHDPTRGACSSACRTPAARRRRQAVHLRARAGRRDDRRAHARRRRRRRDRALHARPRDATSASTRSAKAPARLVDYGWIQDARPARRSGR